MSKTKSVTISLPRDVADAADHAAVATHKKRSEWYRDAAVQFLADPQAQKTALSRSRK